MFLIAKFYNAWLIDVFINRLAITISHSIFAESYTTSAQIGISISTSLIRVFYCILLKQVRCFNGQHVLFSNKIGNYTGYYTKVLGRAIRIDDIDQHVV